MTARTSPAVFSNNLESGKDIPLFFEGLFNQSHNKSIERIILPCTHEILKKLETIGSMYSNFIQQVVWYSHNQFEIEVLTWEFHGADAREIIQLNPQRAEFVLLQCVAVYNATQEKGLDFIDFSRFSVEENDRVVFPIRWPGKGLSGQNKNPGGLSQLIDTFKQNPHFADLTANRLAYVVESLKAKYHFNPDTVYLYNYDEFSTNILHSYPITERPEGNNIKIRIDAASPVIEKIIAGKMFHDFLSEEILFVAVQNGSPQGSHSNLPKIIAQVIGEDSMDIDCSPSATIEALRRFLDQSAYKGFALMVDRIQSGEDTRFLDCMMQLPGIPVTELIVFHVDGQGMSFDLELKENPRNVMTDFLRFTPTDQPPVLSVDETRCLQTIAALADPVPFDFKDKENIGNRDEGVDSNNSSDGNNCNTGNDSNDNNDGNEDWGMDYERIDGSGTDGFSHYVKDDNFSKFSNPGNVNTFIKKVFDHISPSTIHGLVSRGILIGSRGNLVPAVDFSALNLMEILPDREKEIALLKPFVEEFPQDVSTGFATSLKYSILTENKESLVNLLEMYLNNGAGRNINRSKVMDVIGNGISFLEQDVSTLRLLVQILLKENHLDVAERVIVGNLNRDPVFLRLKSAGICRITKDILQMGQLLKEIRRRVPGDMLDEYYYLSFVFHETTDSKWAGADQYAKKIKSPLYKHLTHIKLSDRHIYRGNYEKAADLLNDIPKFLNASGWIGCAIDAEMQLAKLAREKGNVREAEALYKNLFYKSRVGNFPYRAAYIANDLGNLYFGQEDLSQADTWYNKALKLFQGLRNENGIILAKSNLVEICKIKGDWVWSDKALKETVSFYKKRNVAEAVAYDHFNIAHLEYLKHNVLQPQNTLTSALAYFTKNKKVMLSTECHLLQIKCDLLRAATCEKKQLPGDISGSIAIEALEALRKNKHLAGDQKITLRVIELLINAVNGKGKGEVLPHIMAKILERISSMKSKHQQFDLLVPVIGIIGTVGGEANPMMEKLKTLSMALSGKRKNYYYYEYYFTVFDYLLKRRKSIPDTDRDVFLDTFYFFSRNNRNISNRIEDFKKKLDANDPADNVFRGAELVKRHNRWKVPGDMFKRFKKEVTETIPVDMLRLTIYERSGVLFRFSSQGRGDATAGRFDRLTDKIMETAVEMGENLNLGLDDIKKYYRGDERVFYFYKNTRVIVQKISDTLLGVVMLAFLEEECRDYNYEERGEKVLKRFAPLIENYYENDYKIGHQLVDIIGESPAIIHLKKIIHKISKTDFPVLISGENGSGKGLVAKGIHRLSTRGKNEIVPVNAAAIPENLLEAEFFGCKKGAFSGADADRVGLVEKADGGTLFLDEIADLPLALQAKLLRVLEEKEVRRLGDTRTIKVDFRLICATNKNLTRMVAEGSFRKDLYYRIADLVIEVPPLRERREDIPLLVRHFMEREKFTIDEKSLQRICENFQLRSWPGNIRELDSNIKRLITFYPDSMRGYLTGLESGVGRDREECTGESGPDSNRDGKGVTLAKAWENLERTMIMDALISNEWNKTHAADSLGITRPTLLKRIKYYGLDN